MIIEVYVLGLFDGAIMLWISLAIPSIIKQIKESAK